MNSRQIEQIAVNAVKDIFLHTVDLLSVDYQCYTL